MGLKQYLIKKIIEFGILPCSIRWKKSVSGIGRMYAEIMEMMQKEYGGEGVKKLSNVMYDIGVKQADEIIKTLGLEKNLEGCVYALLAMHRIFGIKSKIVKKEKNKAVIHVTGCYWGKKVKCWVPKTCASIAQYETGLVKGILSNASHIYTKRRSLGDEVCELIITVREGEKDE